MPRRSPRMVALWLCAICTASTQAGEFAFHHENVMGTSLELRVEADSAAVAKRVEDRVLAEIDRLASIFSGYDATSEFRRWLGSTGPVKVSPELFEMLEASDSWRTRSGGAFDPRVEVLSRLWTSSARLGRAPTAEELGAAKAAIRRPSWRLDRSAGTAERLSDTPLSLDAIAKGYIVEKACDAALQTSAGVRGLLLNVGGDMRVAGDLSRAFAIASPRADSETSEPIAYASVRDSAVATSGRSQRGWSIGGRWYSHILDPRTGRPAEGVGSATVIAASSADADALATILNVLPIEEGLRLVKNSPGTECLLVSADGRIAKSDGWARYETTRTLALGQDAKFKSDAEKPAKAAPADAFGNEFEVEIHYEIKEPDAANMRRYRRPYVAVWVEDKDGRIVRNLILWVSLGGAGNERWLPDMRRWYKSEEARKKDDPSVEGLPTARPTRPPGKYHVVWDGKDDHGRLLPAGEYVISIDAAREHGTYQNIRKSVVLAKTPFVEELKGNVEIQSASIEYRRKAASKK